MTSLPPLPPGDPDVLRVEKGSLQVAAQEVRSAGKRQQQIVSDLVGASWHGPAADQATRTVEDVWGSYRQLVGSVEDAAEALGACARQWDEAQATYRRAEALAQQAARDNHKHPAQGAAVPGGQSTTVNPLPDGGQFSALDNEARRLAQEAIDKHHNASGQLAQTLSGIADRFGPPPTPPTPQHVGLLGRLWHGMEHEGEQMWHTTEQAGSALWHDLPQILSQGNPTSSGEALGDSAGMLVGLLLMGAGGAVFGAGDVADATGVGIPAGAALDLVGGAGVIGGGAVAAYETDQLQQLLHDPMETRRTGVRAGDPGYNGNPTKPGFEDGATPTEGAAPYNKALAEEVPDWGEPNGKTTGIAELPDGEVLDIRSGQDTDLTPLLHDLSEGGSLKGTGMSSYAQTHVEAKLAMYMRLSRVREATLYINRDFCPTCSEGFARRYLPEGSTVTVYGPSGVTVVHGEGPEIPDLPETKLPWGRG